MNFVTRLLLAATCFCFAINAQARDVDTYSYVDNDGLHFGTELVIDATPEQIWDVLTDLESYSNWNFFTPRVETTFDVGSPIILYVRLIRALPDAIFTQPETVAVFEENQRMCWSDFQLSEEAFTSFRCVEIKTNKDGETVVANTMRYSGYLWPLIGGVSKSAVLDGFEDASIGLKLYAEGL